jgi:1,4-alpha-glucan branching enzyme
VLQYPRHAGVQRWVRDLNRLYRTTPALHELDFTKAGFAWVDCADADISVISYLRMGSAGPPVLVVCNFTPVPRPDFRLGVPRAGRWREALNSDAAEYGGSGQGNLGGVVSEQVPDHGHRQSLRVRLPPLAVLVLTPE